jgi:2-polyprenyl-6-methoxyphenol hydroxylase-like FAD-dependent oxidoreductase
MPTGVAKGLKVAIIGGSIAGCAAAIELLRAGCHVTVFERSTGKLKDRGAGITISLSLFKTLIERGLVDFDMSHFPAEKRPFVIRSSEDSNGLGRIIWEQPIAVALTSWDVLYRNLRSRVPDDIYFQGREVTALHEIDGNPVSLQFSDGQKLLFDLVICAEGHNSLGRSMLFPDRHIEYAGYIAWRGLIEEKLVPDIQPFEGRLSFAVYEFGHCVLYIVPGRNEETEIGKRRLNWVLYENVADKDLPRVLTDVQGVVHKTSLPPGAVPDTQVAYVHNLARQQLPGYVANVVCATTQPFIQSIIEVRIPRYSRGPICLIGDASIITRPHTASGVVKAIANAITLADSLTTHNSLESALGQWDSEQSAEGNRLLTLGQTLGMALVQRVPDWKKMDEEDLQQWWTAIMSGKYWYATDESKEKK